MTVVMVNNQIYAMTGGQVAPSTPFGAKTQTTPYGIVEKSSTAARSPSPRGPRSSAAGPRPIPSSSSRPSRRRLNHKGFSFIEIVSQCPVQTGRYLLGSGSPEFNLKWIKDHCVKQEDPAKWAEVEAQGNIPIGDFLQMEKPEFMEEVAKMNQRVKEAQAKGGDR